MGRKILLFVFGLFVFGVFAYFFVSYKAVHSVGSAKSPVQFEIKEGQGVKEIAKNLEEEGIIENDTYFVFYLFRNKIGSQLKTGGYTISPGLKIPEIAQVLIGGDERKRQVKITFPEGFDRRQIAERLSENGFSREDFLEKTENIDWAKREYAFLNDESILDLEGFLFPDTYFFFKGSTTEEIVRRMLDAFEQKVADKLESESQKQAKSAYDVLAMASLIEREVKTEEDRKIVSGIFWQRLADNHPLQSSAPLTFILGEKKRQYSFEDTRIESPYNTYINVGLPPGPICNPGTDAIDAALFPIETDYYYFLNNPETGVTVFSKTIEEHNANKNNNNL